MSGAMHKLMPARSAKDMSMIVDLDDLITRPVGFKFQGKIYRVEPVSAQTFMELSDALSEAGNLLAAAKAGDKIAEVQVYEAYQKFVSVLVPKFTVNILKEMQLPQVHALINLIIKHATGQPMSPQEITEKKKLSMNL
jgi:hypothetical protein